MHGGARLRRAATTPGSSWFEEQGIEGVGFGWINLPRAAGAGRHELLGTGPTTSSSRSRRPIADWGRRSATAVRGRRPTAGSSRAPTCVQETVGPARRRGPGDDRAAPAARPPPGPPADTVEAALVGACDGELSVGPDPRRPGASCSSGTRPSRTPRRTCRWSAELVAEGFLSAGRLTRPVGQAARSWTAAARRGRRRRGSREAPPAARGHRAAGSVRSGRIAWYSGAATSRGRRRSRGSMTTTSPPASASISSSRPPWRGTARRTAPASRRCAPGSR